VAREPVVAGQFYEGEKESLQRQVKECFSHKLGPGMPKDQGNQGNLPMGIISPHAGFMFSGPCAAHSFARLKTGKQSPLFFIIGLSHRGGPSAFSAEDWQTPLGIAKNDVGLTRKLSETTGIKINEQVHAPEHSLEVQLPFLQYLYDEFTFVPLIISPDKSYKAMAQKCSTILSEIKRPWSIVVSSDFTHYGFNYGYVPFLNNVKENMKKLDGQALSHIESLDSEGFLKCVEVKKMTICGNYPIAFSLALAKRLGAAKASTLCYYTSGDMLNDYANAREYASVVFE